MKILGIIIALLMLFTLAACSPAAPLVTEECTDPTTSSLTAHAKVNSLEAGSLSKRGFVYWEGAEGDPAHNITIIPLINPSFEEGDPPDGWQLDHGGGASWERSTEYVKLGSYSVKLSIGTNWAMVRQEIPNYEDYRGKQVTFGAWVYHPTVDNGVYLLISDGVNYTIKYSSTATSWEWLTVTHNVDSNATKLSVRLRVHEGRAPNTSGYFDGTALVENAVFEDGTFGTGEYSLNITGLKPDTSYRVRAFGENEAGIGYGNTVTCKTL